MLWPPRPFLGGLTGVLARARGTWAGAFRSDATSGATGQRGNPVVALRPNPRYEYQYQYPSHPCTWPRWRSKPLPASTRSASVYGVGIPVAEWADASPRDAPATCVRSLCEQRGSPPLAALSAASSEMLHPLLDTVANFVWRIAVPRPWPSEHVRPERSDDQHDRGRISRNNARAHILLAVQAVTVAPFTCVYVSAATHLGRQPGVFPFKGNFRAFRSIIAAEGALGLFKVPAQRPPHPTYAEPSLTPSVGRRGRCRSCGRTYCWATSARCGCADATPAAAAYPSS